MPKVFIGDRVYITDGSSYGHTGVVVAVRPSFVKVRLDHDGKVIDTMYFDKIG